MKNLNNSVKKQFENYSGLLENLLAVGEIKAFNAGDIIFSEQKNIKSIPIVLSGSVKVSRTEEDGKEIFLYYLHEGESCVMSFFGSKNQCLTKVKTCVEENADILFIPLQQLNSLETNKQWLSYIFSLYNKRFEELLEVINDISFKKIDERLFDLLIKKSSIQNNKEIKITHEQLANELGTARVVVSRLLKQLEIQGNVQLGRNKIILCN